MMRFEPPSPWATLIGSAEAGEQLRAISGLAARDRPRALVQLNELFRRGVTPDPPLDGRYAGQLLALDVAPGLTALLDQIAASWMPWRGKRFDAARSRGDNVFTVDSYVPARVLWPGYTGYTSRHRESYHAFAFRTYVGPGLVDPDRQVLKIDYALPENPARSIRRVLDELVQIGEGFYFGKAHFHWWHGPWTTVAYFSLERVRPLNSPEANSKHRATKGGSP